jgi:hypothetical protein
LDRAGRWNGGKVHLGIEHVIEKVRQRINSNQGDDLDDVRIRVFGIADGFKIGIA